MTDIYNYTCQCKHEGTSTDLFCGVLCPKCKVNVIAAIDRDNLINGAINQTNRTMYVISGYFCLFNERSM